MHCSLSVEVNDIMLKTMQEKEAFWDEEKRIASTQIQSQSVVSSSPCVNGKAGVYPCKNINMLARMTSADLGVDSYTSDMWGWVDPVENREYGIVCGGTSTSIVDITVPESPVTVAIVPGSDAGSSYWCDVKVYRNSAYIIRDAVKIGGLQVFDLTRLRTLRHESGISTAVRDTHLTDIFTKAHNVIINEDSGTLYVVGAKDKCSGGLVIFDLANPLIPVYVNCVSSEGYTHDAQCVTYAGPDSAYNGKEICISFNQNKIVVTDHTLQNQVKRLSSTSYYKIGYTHQGWLTPDHSYMVVNDELDEYRGLYGGKTRTIILDMRSLKKPKVIGQYVSSETSIDHNNYIWPSQPNLAYQANYCAGLRILDVSNISVAVLREVAYFDVNPSCSKATFSGAWSNFLFPSGVAIVNNFADALFILKVQTELLQLGSATLTWDTISKKSCRYRKRNIMKRITVSEIPQCLNQCESDLNCQALIHYGNKCLFLNSCTRLRKNRRAVVYRKSITSN